MSKRKKEFEEEEESLDLDESEEAKDRLSNVIKISSIVLGIVFVLLLVWIVVLNLTNEDKGQDLTKPKEELIDVSLIPTYEGAEQVLGKAWDEIVGMEYEEFFEEYEVAQGSYFRIPSTFTYMDNNAVTGVVENLGLIQLAYQMNPFLIDEQTPEVLAQFDDEVYANDEVELPDGTTINMRTVEQVYSDVRVYLNETNPLKYTYQGYVDGGYFEEEVDLTAMYEKYANY